MGKDRSMELLSKEVEGLRGEVEGLRGELGVLKGEKERECQQLENKYKEESLSN